MWGWFQKPSMKAQAAGDYTSAVIADIEARATGGVGRPELSGEVQAAVAMLSRAMLAVKWAPEWIPRDCASLAARSLALHGNSYFHVLPVKGGYLPVPVSAIDIQGKSEDPTQWRYFLQTSTPSGNVKRERGAKQVWHFRWHQDAKCPYRGRSPLRIANDSSLLYHHAHAAIRDETLIPPLRLLPRSQTSTPDQRKELVENIKRGRGGIVPTQAVKQDAGRESDPAQVTPRPDAQVIGLRSDILTAAVESLGVPSQLLSPGVAGQSRLNAWRQLLIAGVSPICEIIKQEIELKTEAKVEYSLKALRASDIANQARAFHIFSMQEGMDETRALELAGIEEE